MTSSRAKSATCASRTAAGFASRWSSRTPTSSGCRASGFQTVYRLFNDLDDVVCERVFLPPKQELQAQLASGTPLLTLESQTPVADFDVIAFSVSFEWDYTNVVSMLRLAQAAAACRRRETRRHPLVVIGGAVTFVNPEPLALVCRRDRGRRRRGPDPGPDEAACARPTIAPTCCGGWRRSVGSTFRRSTTSATSENGSIAAFEPKPGTNAPPVVKKAAVKSTDRLDPPATSIFTPDTEFGSRFLIEVVRGCANLCRFCWAGYNYLPVRAFSADRILELAARGQTALVESRPRLDRAVRSPGDRADPERPARHGLFDQPGVASPRRPDAEFRRPAAPERRAVDHDRARSRVRPAATRHQQDRHQRGDPQRRRDDLRRRHGQPEALLHDRAADRDRRGSRRHPRSHGRRCARSC